MRVVRMNESTSDKFDNIPLPARQQLGYFDETVDVDARSGNGVDKLRVDDIDDGRDYGAIPVSASGTRVQEVTYHLHPAPEVPETRESEERYATTQRAAPGRNERMAAALGAEDHASVPAGSDRAAAVLASTDTPRGTTQQVLDWVGDDKDRARQALEQEDKRENPRSGLKSKLEDIAGK
jgi:hypothetical protein